MTYLLIALLSCFILAVLLPTIFRRLSFTGSLLLAIFPAIIFTLLLSFLPSVTMGTPLLQIWEWVPIMQANIALRVDGLSLLFGLIISGIGCLVFIYSAYYLKGDPQLLKFFVLLLLFMGSMLGVVFSDNLLLMFVFWELTSLTSYFLIGFNHNNPTARASALQALLVTATGGLIMLPGILLLGLTGGSFEYGQLLQQVDLITQSPWLNTIIILILIGAFTKSAQFPFHFWLPNAMVAPTPVSTYLHSATMVKAGIYLIARLSPIFEGILSWQLLLVSIGIITMLIGALRALVQTDLKRILAFATVSSLGTTIFLLGLGTPLSIVAACAYILAHALYKGALFMIAGIIDHECGSREITNLKGLLEKMPLTACCAIMAALSMIGIPPFIGYVVKDLIYETTLDFHYLPTLFTIFACIINAALAASALLVAVGPFIGRTRISPKPAHDPSVGFMFPPFILALLGLLAGLTINLVVGDFITTASKDIYIHPHMFSELALWHGFNLPFLFSLVTIFIALLLYIRADTFRKFCQFKYIAGFDCEKIYKLSLHLLMQFAKFQTKLLQNGSLRNYLITIFLTTIALLGLALFPLVNESTILERHFSITPWEIALAGLIVVGAATLIRSDSRLSAVAALGVVGYGVALLFTLFGAPDLGITQFAIETLTVILFVFVLYRLPRLSQMTSKLERLYDVGIAVAFGVMMTLLILVITATPLNSRISPFFAANSYLLGKGRNVVNVILVDFRALDTYGEITVLTIAAIGVYALIKLRLN